MLRALLVAATALLAACGHRPRHAAPVRIPDRIVLLADTIDSTRSADTLRFGRLGSGEIAVARFALHNATPRPLRIVAVERSCGCLTLECDDRPIRPDERRPVALAFDTRGEWGWQFKLVEIAFDGLPHPARIYVEAEVH